MVPMAQTLVNTIAAILVIAVQATISPASCCLLRAELLGTGSCCYATEKAESTPSCCSRSVSSEKSLAVGGSHGSDQTDVCPVCTSGPKVASSEKSVAPEPDFATGILLPVVSVEATSTTPSPVEFVADEPFHRTAIAACAWLCVWLK